MRQSQKRIVILCIVVAMLGGVSPVVNAMHIMEGYLSPAYCVGWGIISLPFLLKGYFTIKRKVEDDQRSLVLLAMAGAFIFVMSSLKIPSVTGSSSHMTGTGLGAILFGPSVVSVLGIIVLLFQAILLAHGGLTTLGANTFSMAIAGPIISFILYKISQKMKIHRYLGIFLAAFAGDLCTYCMTSIQLGLAYPSVEGGTVASVLKFLAVFAPTQIPLAIIEGILTVMIIVGLETYATKEMTSIQFMRKGVEQ